MNANKGFAWLSLLPYILGAMAVAGTLWAGYRWYHNLCNDRCRIAEERATTAEEAIQAAQARASHLAVLWADAIQRVEKVYVEVEKSRGQRFDGIRERAGKIELAACPIPNDAAVLLRDIERAANTPGPAAVAGSSNATPAPVPESADWIDFAAAAGEAYRERDDARLECVARYNEMRNKIIEVQGE